VWRSRASADSPLRRGTGRPTRALAAVASAIAGAVIGALVAPAAVGAHQMVGRLESPLPLWAYLGGAAVAVALSFAFVFAWTVKPAVPRPRRVRGVPRWVRWPLRAIGLFGWGWVLVQALLFPGSSTADVSSLFLWVYGWVGLALISALIGPAWSFLDPFTALHDGGAWLLRRLGVGSWPLARYPKRLGAWPAAIGYATFVWLELIVTGGGGGRTMGVVLLAYTALTLLGMAQFGKDEWRRTGEVFSVWFGTLGRFAPIALDGEPQDARVRLRGWGAGLLEPGWTAAHVALVTFGVVGVIFDGISQTRTWVDIWGLPSIGLGTVLLVAWLSIAACVALGVARLVGGPDPSNGGQSRATRSGPEPSGGAAPGAARATGSSPFVAASAGGRQVGLAALGAGLTPIAIGYITAHYFTFLLIDGQRIVVAISDPFQQGWDLLGTAFFIPTGAWLAPAIVWIAQLSAVVGGHMVGAWFGHVAASAGEARGLRVRQLPLAALMVLLTVTTLWSLGQAIVSEPKSGAVPVPRTVASAPWTVASAPRTVASAPRAAHLVSGPSGSTATPAAGRPSDVTPPAAGPAAASAARVAGPAAASAALRRIVTSGPSLPGHAADRPRSVWE